MYTKNKHISLNAVNIRRTFLILGLILLYLTMGISFSYSNSNFSKIENNIQQQKIRIIGTVYDASETPIIGANILEKGTTNGTVTDSDGRFTLDVDDNAILQISYIGYLSQEISTKGKTSLKITMEEDAKALDELVVIGYGTMQKKQVTSSITSLAASDLPKGVGGASIATALQGKVAGLVMSGTASPNSGNTF